MPLPYDLCYMYRVQIKYIATIVLGVKETSLMDIRISSNQLNNTRASIESKQ